MRKRDLVYGLAPFSLEGLGFLLWRCDCSLLMGSSAQDSSGVHWCRRRAKSNEVPAKVRNVPEKVWEALVQSQIKFNKCSEKVKGGNGAKLGQVQQGSGEGSGDSSGEGLGGLGGERGQFQEGSGEGFGKGFGKAMAQSQVKFIKVADKVPEKV